MFSQRRRKYKNIVWASVLTVIAILALVALLGYLGSFRDNTYEETRTNEPVSAQETAQDAVADDDVNEENDDNDDNDDNDGEGASETEGKKQTYYLLKYDNDIIRIYFSDQQGKVTELEETGIVYETLAPEDQKQFQEGIQVENRDALNRLLMDYES